MKNVKILATIMTALFLAGIMAGTVQATAETNPVLTWATQTATKLNKAIESNDYAAYKKPWSAENGKALTKEKFEQIATMMKSIGTMKSMTFYNKFEAKGYTIYQWKATYTKYPQPLYVRLVFKKRNGTYKVDGHFVRKSPK